MLSYKITNRNIKETVRKIDFEYGSPMQDNGGTVYAWFVDGGKFVENDNLLFNREGSKGNVYYENNFFVSPIPNNPGVKINKLPDYELFIKKTYVDFIFHPTLEKNVAILILEFENEHHFRTIRDEKVREDVNENFLNAMKNDSNNGKDKIYERLLEEDREGEVIIKTTSNYEKNDKGKYILVHNDKFIRYCAGDYTVCGGMFLLKSFEDKRGKIKFDNFSLRNTRCTIYFYNENGKKVLLNGIVPYGSNGDDKFKLIFVYDVENTNNLNDFYKNYHTYRVFAEDERFYKRIVRLHFTQDDINVDCSDVKFDNNNIISFRPVGCYDEVVIDENFKLDVEIFYEDNGYSSNTLKWKYRPHKGTNVYKLEDKITLSLPLFEEFETNMNQGEIIGEQFTQKRIDEELNPIVDMEKQVFVPIVVVNKNETEKEIYNNIDTISLNINLLDRGNNWGSGFNTTNTGRTNTLSGIGFTAEDMLYQRNSIKKSFVRLSFYDSKSRANQTLLYYTTIFLDAGEIYGKYVKDKNNASGITLNLEINNSFNRKKSSEGYYLYLYPSLCPKNDVFNTIYMKVEFNHAKYGYTIPLVVNSGNTGYIAADDYISGVTTLLNDMYIPIGIRYNSTNNKYEWEIGYNNENIEKTANKVTINLYEPIINK